jgi:sugar O-acyltransferase (sialic acid O-acetyltransferase NeuD family)
VIFGAGAHGRAVADLVAEDERWVVLGFSDADPARSAADRLGAPVLGDDAAVLTAYARGEFDAGVVGVGNTSMDARRAIFARLAETRVPCAVLVHPQAMLARSAFVGAGTVVFAGVVLAAHVTVGANVVLYSGAIVEHDSVLESHVYCSPGVVLAGAVTVREGAFLGAGAVVLPGLEIGRDAVVGAGAVVTESVAAGSTVAGVPARALRVTR